MSEEGSRAQDEFKSYGMTESSTTIKSNMAFVFVFILVQV